MSKETKVALISGIFAILAAIIGAVIGGYFLLRSNGSSSTSNVTATPTVASTPDNTLSSFCLLIRANGLDYAYRLYSSNLQKTVTPTDFHEKWGKTLSSCISSIASSSDSSAKGTISTTEFPSGQMQTYNVTLIKDNSNDSRHGYWLIDSVQP